MIKQFGCTLVQIGGQSLHKIYNYKINQVSSFTYLCFSVNDIGLADDIVKLNIIMAEQQLVKPRPTLRWKVLLIKT